MPLRVASVADADVAQSAVWLDQQQAGLGDDFLDAVEATFAEIAANPLACPTLVLSGSEFKSPLRWLRVGRFPHMAIFTVIAGDILIVAVLHGHRDLEAILQARVGAP